MDILKSTAAALLIALVTGLGFTASGCNTMEGVGQDVEAGGDAVEDTARKSKPY